MATAVRPFKHTFFSTTSRLQNATEAQHLAEGFDGFGHGGEMAVWLPEAK